MVCMNEHRSQWAKFMTTPVNLFLQRGRSLTTGLCVAVSLLISLDYRGLDRGVLLAAEASGPGSGSGGNSTTVQVSRMARPKNLIEQLAELADPEASDWDTELLSATASKKLKQLATMVEQPESFTVDAVQGFVDDQFTCGDLRPSALTEVFRDRWMTVHRAADGALAGATEGPVGPEGLVAAIQRMLKPLGREGELHLHFKLFNVERGEDVFTTRQYVEANSRGLREGMQINAMWRCQWRYPDASTNQVPQLLHIEVERYEQLVLQMDQGRQFVDCTESAMSRNPSYERQILPSSNHWMRRIPTHMDVTLTGSHGVTVGDVNGDGLEDLYMCEMGGLPNRLFVQNPDGTVTDVSAESGVDWLNFTSAALMIDFDNDGDQDLVLSTIPDVIFAENDGQGHFRIRSSLRVTFSGLSISAADYDNDGDVDVYFCTCSPTELSGAFRVPIPYYDANNGGPNVLLRNEGDFRFVDVTDEVGLGENNSRFSLAVAWEDYDNDGDQDLYVANDFGRNCLYRNEGGQFVDVAPDLRIEDLASGMSVSWQDYNRDGRVDLYVSNMFSAAGNRVTYQRRFTDAYTGVVAHMQRMARGNSLFVNRGVSGFTDVSEEAGVTMGRWAWASKFGDLNNDGWPDLVVANGYYTNEDSGDL